MYNEEIHKIIEKYNIKCTFSVDGLEEDNDRNRIYKNGRGTFKIIEENFSKLKNHIFSIEATYDGQSKYDKTQIKEQLYSKFSVPNITIGGLYQNKNIRFEAIDFKEEFIKIMKDLPLKNEFIIRILSEFFGEKKKPHSYCEAGMSVLSIDSDGKIYPCQLMIQKGNDEFNFGSICDFNLNSFKVKRENFFKYQNKDLNYKCAECNGKWLCKHCIARSLGYEQNRCEGFMNNLEECLEEIAEYIISGKLDTLIKNAGEEIKYV